MEIAALIAKKVHQSIRMAMEWWYEDLLGPRRSRSSIPRPSIQPFHTHPSNSSTLQLSNIYMNMRTNHITANSAAIAIQKHYSVMRTASFHEADPFA